MFVEWYRNKKGGIQMFNKRHMLPVLCVVTITLTTIGCESKKEGDAATKMGTPAVSSATNPLDANNANAPAKNGAPPGVDPKSRPDMNAPGPRVVK